MFKQIKIYTYYIKMSEAVPVVNETTTAEANELEKPKTAPPKKKDGRSKQRTPAQLAATEKMLKAKAEKRDVKRKEKDDKKQQELNEAVEKEITKRKPKSTKQVKKDIEGFWTADSGSSSSDDDGPQPPPVRRKSNRKKQPVVQYHNYYYGNTSSHTQSQKRSDYEKQQSQKTATPAPPVAQPKKERPAIKFV